MDVNLSEKKKKPTRRAWQFSMEKKGSKKQTDKNKASRKRWDLLVPAFC